MFLFHRLSLIKVNSRYYCERKSKFTTKSLVSVSEKELVCLLLYLKPHFEWYGGPIFLSYFHVLYRPPHSSVLHNYTLNYSKQDGLLFRVKQGSIILSPVSDEKLNRFYKQFFCRLDCFHRWGQQSFIPGLQYQPQRSNLLS